jgi:hypothetical protein
MRKALLAASVVALLVVLYTAAGQWLAPRFVRDALIGRAQRAGLALQIAEVDTDPFRLTVALSGVRLLDGERELAAARRLYADLAWSSLWQGAWRVQQATLVEPTVVVVRGGDGAALGSRRGEGETLPLLVEQLTVEGGSLRFVDRSPHAPVDEVRVEAIGLQMSGLSTLKGDPAAYELSARVAQGGKISSQGSVTLEPLAARGRIVVAALPLDLLVGRASGQLRASAQYAFDGEAVVLTGVTLEGAQVAHSGLELSQVVLRSPRIRLPAAQAPIEVSGSAAPAAGGELSASGRVSLQPPSADLEVKAAGLPLPQLNRFLPEDLAVSVKSGTGSAQGRLRIVHGQTSYEGQLEVSQARFEEEASGELLIAWEALTVQQATLSYPALRAELGEVVATVPSGRLVIERDGKLNFARVFPQRDNGGKRPHIAVRRLRLERGVLDFADRSLENDFAVKVRELEGTITGFSTEPGNAARVQLEGRVAEYGAARIRGTVNVDAPTSLTNITATLRNVPLAELTPYVVKFAGYRVRSGRLSAELRYRVREGRLVGQNQLTFEELQLGEKVAREGAKDLPLEAAVALLTDANGRIQLDIPVSGNLNDPQFNLGGLFARALGNVVGKIVSAPFRALAAAFGKGGEDLDQVRFEPGSAELGPPAEETVAQVAKALAARPRLAVTVQGGYDPRRDLDAMRRAHVRGEIAQRAGVAADAPLDFGDPKVLQAAERLYLERAGNRLQMLELRERERRYGRALVEALAAATPAGEEAVRILARARAEMVRAGLLAHGVDPARVGVEGPAAREAQGQGVPTTLALGAARNAAAGATAPAR